jgi:hypothetical protein
VEQFKLNIYVYAELLFRWQLFHKRLELLKAVGQQDGIISNTEPHRIGELNINKNSFHMFSFDPLSKMLSRFAPAMPPN